ncbi:MAG: hypothetical protein GC168_06235 [Candidatus Hydrogenedens sp.]|nr:hypothetical protein [Candidatus Hydrogenedens sp.]
MLRCVLLSCDDLTDFTVDDDLLLEPFAAQGWQAEFVPWNAPDVDWSRYDAAIIRATWDYTFHLPDFLDTLQRIESLGVPLFNPWRVAAWNAHKGYLLELEAQGVPIVPTRVVDRETNLRGLFDTFSVDELVIKPMVSAGAYNTFRFTRDAVPEIEAKLRGPMGEADLMAQPFVASLLSQGEYSLFYFNGAYSHAVVKQPTPGDFRVQEEHGGIISPVQPSAALRAAGDAALAAVPEDCLYARVDLLESPEGEWQVIEIELIEPSLYFRMDKGSPERFVRAFLERID